MLTAGLQKGLGKGILHGRMPRANHVHFRGLFREQKKLANFKRQEWFCCEVCSEERAQGKDTGWSVAQKEAGAAMGHRGLGGSGDNVCLQERN